MPYEYLVIIHIIGTALGAGGATFSDFLFYKVIKDGKIDRDEYELLNMSSFLVWAGFITLLISGFLFLSHPDFPGIATKLYAKLVIVGIILVNAIIMHSKIFPCIKYHVKKHRKLTKQPFEANIGFTLVSGAVSIVSWYSALIIGGWRGLDASFSQIIAVYFALLLLAIIVSQFAGRKFMKSI